jgi:hypothetical protein
MERYTYVDCFAKTGLLEPWNGGRQPGDISTEADPALEKNGGMDAALICRIHLCRSVAKSRRLGKSLDLRSCILDPVPDSGRMCRMVNEMVHESFPVQCGE